MGKRIIEVVAILIGIYSFTYAMGFSLKAGMNAATQINPEKTILVIEKEE